MVGKPELIALRILASDLERAKALLEGAPMHHAYVIEKAF